MSRILALGLLSTAVSGERVVVCDKESSGKWKASKELTELIPISVDNHCRIYETTEYASEYSVGVTHKSVNTPEYKISAERLVGTDSRGIAAFDVSHVSKVISYSSPVNQKANPIATFISTLPGAGDLLAAERDHVLDLISGTEIDAPSAELNSNDHYVAVAHTVCDKPDCLKTRVKASGVLQQTRNNQLVFVRHAQGDKVLTHTLPLVGSAAVVVCVSNVPADASLTARLELRIPPSQPDTEPSWRLAGSTLLDEGCGTIRAGEAGTYRVVSSAADTYLASEFELTPAQVAGARGVVTLALAAHQYKLKEGEVERQNVRIFSSPPRSGKDAVLVAGDFTNHAEAVRPSPSASHLSLHLAGVTAPFERFMQRRGREVILDWTPAWTGAALAVFSKHNSDVEADSVTYLLHERSSANHAHTHILLAETTDRQGKASTSLRALDVMIPPERLTSLAALRDRHLHKDGGSGRWWALAALLAVVGGAAAAYLTPKKEKPLIERV